MRICGVEIPEDDLSWLRACGMMADGPSRSAVARELCQRLGLVDRLGKPRVVTTRIALRRLERRKLIRLPARQGFVPRRAATKKNVALPENLYRGSATTAREIDDLQITPVRSSQPKAHEDWNGLMDSRHPLGSGPLCGAQIRYLVHAGDRLLGGLAFSSCAWRLKARDEWIGWSDTARDNNRHLVVANSRFLLVPRIPNLASRVLALCLDRLPGDWQNQYGYKPLLVETFVDPEHFRGTCYRAAGWTSIGKTAGRGRQDRDRQAELKPKDIFVVALDPEATEKLGLEPIVPLRTDGDWADTEFAEPDLPDKRLCARLRQIARDLYAQPRANIPQACGSRARTKALYRFCAHKSVNMDAILQSHYEATVARAAQEKIVLAVQDTTSLNYTTHPATEDLGPIGSFGAQATLGLHVHSTLLINPAGTPLGLLDVQCWARDAHTTQKAADRAALPIDQKESRKWLESYRATARAQQRLTDTKLVNVGDREADVFELFVEARRRPDQPGLLVRAVHPRKLLSNTPKAPSVWDHVRALPCAGTLPLTVPRRGSRPRRQTTLELRFAEVELRPPLDSQRKSGVKMWAIAATEVSSQALGKPIEWLLLTNLPTTSVEEAAEKLDWYTLRWQIEVFHRTLKSGCGIEERQLGSAHSLQACLAIDMVVAWRIFHLAKLGRETPDAPCTDFFEEAEWKALVFFLTRRPPPPTPPSLRDAVRMVGGLGGFLGRKSDGEPGTQTLWRGLQRLDDITLAYRVFTPSPPDTS